MNILLSLAGLIGWIWWRFTSEKDVYDKDHKSFPFKQYISENWDNWIWAVVWAVVLLLVGHAALGVQLLRAFNLDMQWSDLFYLASGPASLIANHAFNFIKQKFA